MYNGFTYPLEKNEHNTPLLAIIKKEAVALAQKPMKALSYDSFKLFEETGSRVEYEAEYFEHRKMLSAFAAMALTGDNWIAKLSDVIWAICDEYTWALPAHLSEAKTIEDVIGCIDLFASETAFTLSEIYDILGDKLPAAVAERIIYEVKRRIVIPFLNQKQGFEDTHNNWSAVCCSGVGAAMIYLGLDDAFVLAKDRLLSCMQNFLASYHEDGCCMEGSLYWSYGFSFFCYFAELLKQYTGGDVDFFKDEKVKRIAYFGQNTYLKENYTVSFADCPHTCNYESGMWGLLSDKYEGILQPDNRFESKFGDDVRYRFAHLVRNLYWGRTAKASNGSDKRCIYYENAQWYINKKNVYCFAAKGGCNKEPHNHNDIGSFLFYDNGQYILDDLGWPQYTKDYFLENRYENMCASSLGHSVPVVDGNPQQAGAHRTARVLAVTEHSFSIEMAAAYDLPQLTSLKRTFRVNPDGITITDLIKGNYEVLKERFVTRVVPEAAESQVRIGEYVLTCDKKTEIQISSFTFIPRFSGENGQENVSETAYCIDFIIKNCSKVCISLQRSKEV